MIILGFDWYYKAINYISARNISSGIENGNFKPDNIISRVDFIVMLMKAYKIELDGNPSGNFSDAGDTYYTNYLATAKRMGFSRGTGNNLFSPNRELKRQEMITLIYNTLKYLNESLSSMETIKELSAYSDAGSVED